jgi:hypothetical protein
MIARAWREHSDHIVPFLALPGELRRVVDTTNTIEGLHRQIHKAINTRGHFPDEQAANKLIYLAIEKSEGKGRANRAWTPARAALKIHFGDRFPERHPPTNQPDLTQGNRTASRRVRHRRRCHRALPGLPHGPPGELAVRPGRGADPTPRSDPVSVALRHPDRPLTPLPTTPPTAPEGSP